MLLIWARVTVVNLNVKGSLLCDLLGGNVAQFYRYLAYVLTLVNYRKLKDSFMDTTFVRQWLYLDWMPRMVTTQPLDYLL